MSSKDIAELMAKLAEIAAKNQKREELHYGLSQELEKAENAIYAMSDLQKRAPHWFTKVDFQELHDVWAEVAKYVDIKEVRLFHSTDGGNKSDEKVFYNPEELEKFISEWPSDKSIAESILTRTPYSIIILI
jgi:hypothetical protein